LFGAVSILSGALMGVGLFSQYNGGQMFNSICGANQDYFDQHDPWRLAETNANVLREKTVVRIMVGDQDTMGNQVPGYEVRKADRAFHEHLERLEIPHQYLEVPGVPHAYAALFFKTGEPALDFYKRAFERLADDR
jgi:S-formylglutathione hydrolase FrmB